MIARTIPKEDLNLINKALKPSNMQAITVNVNGDILSKSTEKANRGYVLQNFSGRIIKHRIAVWDKQAGMVIIANAGDKYDTIPLERRNKFGWSESDFQ